MAYTPILTNTGISLYSAAFAGGTTLNVNTMVFGDGGGIEPTPNPTQTALVNQLFSVTIANITIVGNQVTFEGIILQGATSGFTLREVGLKDSSGNLTAVSNYPSTIITAIGKEIHIKFIVTISNAASVVLNVNSSAVFALKSYVDSQDALKVNIVDSQNALSSLKSYVDSQDALKVNIVDSSLNASHIIKKPNWIYNNDGVITGALQIKINSLYAKTLSFGMYIQLTQDNFVSDGTYPDYNFYVSGDWRNSGTAWHNTEATLNTSIQTSVNVRFANNGTDCFIILGDINTVWNNPRVIIQEVFQNQIVANYVIDFTISTITILPTNINSTVSAQSALIGTPAAIALYLYHEFGTL